MVSKGQFVGLDWNRITRLHSQVMIGTQEVKNSLTASRCHLNVTTVMKKTIALAWIKEWTQTNPQACVKLLNLNN